MTDKPALEGLTVGQVIEKLQKVKDKSTPVYSSAGCFVVPIVSVTEESGDVYGKVILTASDFPDDFVSEDTGYFYCFNCFKQTKFIYDNDAGSPVCSQDCLNHLGDDV